MRSLTRLFANNRAGGDGLLRDLKTTVADPREAAAGYQAALKGL